MGFFLRQFAGFFIQSGFAMILFFLPFNDEALRYSKKRMYVGMGIVAVIASGIFALIISLPVVQALSNKIIIANLYMLFFIVAFVILFFRLVCVQTIKKMSVLVLVVFYSITQYLLVNLATPFFPSGWLPEIYPPLFVFLYAASTVLLFPFMVFLMKKVMSDYLAEVEIKNIKREFAVVFGVTVLYLFLIFFYSLGSNMRLTEFWWLVTPPYLLVAVILFLFYWMLFRESVRRKRDSDNQRAMEIQKLQYENITKEVEHARRIRHDMRHYLNGLNDMLEQNKMEEIKSYLSEIIDNTTKRGYEDYCHNNVVNGLLQYYVGRAQEENIRCEVQAECGELTVSPADLTVLFGNVMENAIRACQAFEENRWIQVQIGIIGGSLVVQITNPCKEIRLSGHYQMGQEFLPADAFLSTRTGGGYGLGSMNHTAQKYGGDARFRFDETEQTFTTRIQLNLHPEMM